MTEGHENALWVTVELQGKQQTREICGMLRGLLYVIGNNNGRAKKDAEFKRGVTIEFGSAITAQKFVDAIEDLFRKRVRKRLSIARNHHQ